MSWHPCCCGNTACCPGVTIPNTLNVLVTATGTCFDGATTTLTYNAAGTSGAGWYGTFVDVCVQDGTVHNTLTIYFACVGLSFFMSVTESTSGDVTKWICTLGGPFTPGGFTCSPLNATFSVLVRSTTSYAACPSGSTFGTITVTE